jgi:crossover junction endodeoxyribonuclease RusA
VISLTLPFPPSVNHYWRRNGGRYYIAAAGKAFRQAVLEECADLVGKRPLTGRLAMTIGLNPPDRRRRDIGNLEKGIGDSLQAAGIFLDDAQVDRLLIIRGGVRKPGSCTVLVEEIA